MNNTIFYQKAQSVTIPFNTYDIIRNDIDLFSSDHFRLKWNTILNLIVLNLSGESQADFFYYGKNIHVEIENAISVCHKEIMEEAKRLIFPASSRDIGKTAYKELAAFSTRSIRERVEFEYEKQFYAIQNKPVHGKTLRFTLTKKSVRKLYAVRGIPIEKLIGIADEQTTNTDSALCYRTVAKYLSRLFEAYSELSVRDRERVVFSENYNLIESVIKKSRENNVCLSAVVNAGKDSKQLIIKPYRILEDIYTGYNYLIGYARDAFSEDDFSMGSFRISRFVSLQEYKGISPLNRQETEQIMNKLQEVSPAFVRSNAIEIDVLLNLRGKILINTILHNRPKIKQIEHYQDGTSKYTFYCTEFNAFNYFMPFGENAVVISPLSLKQKLYNEFKNAVNAYT